MPGYHCHGHSPDTRPGDETGLASRNPEVHHWVILPSHRGGGEARESQRSKAEAVGQDQEGEERHHDGRDEEATRVHPDQKEGYEGGWRMAGRDIDKGYQGDTVRHTQDTKAAFPVRDRVLLGPPECRTKVKDIEVKIHIQHYENCGRVSFT